MGITFIITGLMGIAFMSFMGIKLEDSKKANSTEEFAQVENNEKEIN